MHANFGLSQGSQQTDFRRPQQFACGQGHFAGAQILARPTHVLCQMLASWHGDGFLIGLHHFLHDDAVCTCRHHRASHDAHGLALSQRCAKRMTGQGRAHQFQCRFTIWLQIGETQGIAIHSRIIMRWHVQRRDHILRQNAVQRLTHEQALLPGNRLDQRQDQLPRTFNRQGVGIVIIGAGQRLQQ